MPYFPLFSHLLLGPAELKVYVWNVRPGDYNFVPRRRAAAANLAAPMVVMALQVSPWLKGWGIYDDFQSWICGINLS